MDFFNKLFEYIAKQIQWLIKHLKDIFGIKDDDDTTAPVAE